MTSDNSKNEVRTIDMSARAVTARLRRVAQLRRLCRTLAASRRLDLEKVDRSG